MTLTDAEEASPMEGVVAKRGKSISREELKRLINETSDYKFTLGDKWFVVANSWWSKVIRESEGGCPDEVPPIDCSSISTKSEDGYFLKAKLSEGLDYQLIPEKIFNRLREIYGLGCDDRDYIERYIVEKSGQKVVEVYPRVVTISLSRDSTKKCTLTITSDDTMNKLKERVLTELGVTNIHESNIRFYIVQGDEYELIDLTQQNVDAYFDTAQKVIVDIKSSDGSWFINQGNDKALTTLGPKTVMGLWLLLTRVLRLLTNWRWLLSTAISFLMPNSPIRSYGGAFARDRQTSYVKGSCGLHNLGNTCFMASAIQCLSNVPALTEYFLSNQYLNDINVTNPLGTRGELAKAYGDLIEMMWSGSYNSVQPRKLKMTIGQYAPRFSGYSQQDSQELMAYLLDGLHEDLNRIKKKPYIEEDEDLSKLDEHIQADKAWAAYRARNDSIIVDKFHGQLKSTLVCPVCSKVSIKFDPFCFLSVPLPSKDRIVKQVITLMREQNRTTNSGGQKCWAKFLLAVTRSTTVEEVTGIMKNNLQFQDDMHIAVFGIGNASDDVCILKPNDSILYDDKSYMQKELFATLIDQPVESSKLLIVKNQNSAGRPLSVPMVYSASSNDKFTREFLLTKALKFTQSMFLENSFKSSSSWIMDKTSNGDDAMSEVERDITDLFKIYVADSLGEYAEVTEDGPLPLTDDRSVVVFKWNDHKLFNGYKGSDLIERESSIPVKKDIPLEDCIDLFTKTEELGEEDSWYCPQCKKHERASKKLELWKLPEILIIHLKRFQYSRWHRDKIEMCVQIPVKNFELNSKLANERHEHVKYDLIALSHHMGGMGGGHYTATALNTEAGKWYEFNDSSASASPNPPDPIIGRTPYLLVYCRRDPAPDGAHADSNFEMETDQ